MVDVWPHLLVKEEGSMREEEASNPASSTLCFNRHRRRIKERTFEKNILMDQLILLWKMYYLGYTDFSFDSQRWAQTWKGLWGWNASFLFQPYQSKKLLPFVTHFVLRSWKNKTLLFWYCKKYLSGLYYTHCNMPFYSYSSGIMLSDFAYLSLAFCNTDLVC